MGVRLTWAHQLVKGYRSSLLLKQIMQVGEHGATKPASHRQRSNIGRGAKVSDCYTGHRT